jgi:hypothetical protein
MFAANFEVRFADIRILKKTTKMHMKFKRGTYRTKRLTLIILNLT